MTGKPKVVIVGSGVTGLSVAYLLRNFAEVTVYERQARMGGHVCTVDCPVRGATISVDTGFVVLNRTYVGFRNLLNELGVVTHSTDASLAVRTSTDSVEMNLASLSGWFGQRKRLLSFNHWALLWETISVGSRVRRTSDKNLNGVSVREFLDSLGAGKRFRDLVAFPLITSIWNANVDVASTYAAATIVKSLRDYYLAPSLDWQAITGGAATYVRKLVEVAKCDVLAGREVRRIEQDGNQVRLFFNSGEPVSADYAVLACPPAMVLKLLPAIEESTKEELRRFGENQTRVMIHTDDRLVSNNSRCRGAWNFIAGTENFTVTYDLKRLMKYESDVSLFSTVNGEGLIGPERVIGKEEFVHVTFPVGATMNRLATRFGRVHVCGAWLGNGNHEAGFQSACEVARQFGIS